MKFTFGQIMAFDEAAHAITNKYGADPKNKLLYSISRNLKKTQPILDKYNKETGEIYRDEHNDLVIDYASVDKDQNLIVDDKGNYVYTKENKKAFTKAVAALVTKLNDRLEEKKLEEFELDVYLTSEFNNTILDELTEEQIEVLLGFCLPMDFKKEEVA